MTEPRSSAARPPLWPVGNDGRRIVRVGEDPETIRVLTKAVNSRIIPDTYVTGGKPVVMEEVSGAGDPTAGDEDVALPLTASPLKPALLANLLAEHANVARPEMDKKGNQVDVEVSPPTRLLSAVLA